MATINYFVHILFLQLKNINIILINCSFKECVWTSKDLSEVFGSLLERSAQTIQWQLGHYRDSHLKCPLSVNCFNASSTNHIKVVWFIHTWVIHMSMWCVSIVVCISPFSLPAIVMTLMKVTGRACDWMRESVCVGVRVCVRVRVRVCVCDVRVWGRDKY